MNVADLKSLLNNYPDDTEVRLMNQSSWPFEYSVLGVWESVPQPNACGSCGRTEEVHDSGDDSVLHSFEPYDVDRFTPSGEKADFEVVYLVEGTQLGYGTKLAWEEVEGAWPPAGW